MIIILYNLLYLHTQLNDKNMTTSNITKGTKILSNNLVMVVTGENEKAYLGYHEYKGNIVGQCSIAKDMFTNPHYMSNIQILN